MVGAGAGSAAAPFDGPLLRHVAAASEILVIRPRPVDLDAPWRYRGPLSLREGAGLAVAERASGPLSPAAASRVRAILIAAERAAARSDLPACRGHYLVLRSGEAAILVGLDLDEGFAAIGVPAAQGRVPEFFRLEAAATTELKALLAPWM